MNMSKKPKKEKKPTFPQSVAVRFDLEDDDTLKQDQS
jgi:hypothetical protein